MSSIRKTKASVILSIIEIRKVDISAFLEEECKHGEFLRENKIQIP
jgi:hypothetical protein